MENNRIFNARCRAELSLRVALFLPAVSISQISAGADCDLQTASVGVVGHGQLQLPGNKDAVKGVTFCADAGDAALRGEDTGCRF